MDFYLMWIEEVVVVWTVKYVGSGRGRTIKSNSLLRFLILILETDDHPNYSINYNNVFLKSFSTLLLLFKKIWFTYIQTSTCLMLLKLNVLYLPAFVNGIRLCYLLWHMWPNCKELIPLTGLENKFSKQLLQPQIHWKWLV